MLSYINLVHLLTARVLCLLMMHIFDGTMFPSISICVNRKLLRYSQFRVNSVVNCITIRCYKVHVAYRLKTTCVCVGGRRRTSHLDVAPIVHAVHHWASHYTITSHFQYWVTRILLQGPLLGANRGGINAKTSNNDTQFWFSDSCENECVSCFLGVVCGWYVKLNFIINAFTYIQIQIFFFLLIHIL